MTHHQTAALSCILNPVHFFFCSTFLAALRKVSSSFFSLPLAGSSAPLFYIPHLHFLSLSSNWPPLVSPSSPPDHPPLNPICLLQLYLALSLLCTSSLLFQTSVTPTGPNTLNPSPSCMHSIKPCYFSSDLWIPGLTRCELR